MRRSFMLIAIVLLLAGPCLAADKVFLMTPANPAQTYPRFHMGVTGIYAAIEKGLVVTVDSTEPDTPAAGKFQKGDILVKVNGQPISDSEPYIVLGEAITAAEASDGKMVFTIKRGEKEESVALTIPVLGAYSRTWPLNCKKSDAIVRQAAAFLAQPANLKDPEVSLWELDGALFALSRAEPADIKKNLGLVGEYLGHQEWWLRESAFAAIVALAKDEKLLAPELPALLARVAKETHVYPRRFLMGQLQSILKDKAISSGMKDQIVTGMLRGIHETVIEPGYLGGIGRNNKYETLRYFLEQAPEAAPQVLDEVEQYIM
jgi:hypothetical protein